MTLNCLKKYGNIDLPHSLVKIHVLKRERKQRGVFVYNCISNVATCTLHATCSLEITYPVVLLLIFPGDSVVKNPPDNLVDAGSISRSRRFPEEGNGNPFQHSYLKKPVDRGAWQATVHGVAKSQIRLSTQFHSYLWL